MLKFRLVEPDFSPLPIFQALKDHFQSDEARALYPGVHQEDHWALAYEGEWERQAAAQAELGSYQLAADSSQATLEFTFNGTDLWLRSGPTYRGAILFSLDGGQEAKVAVDPETRIQLAQELPHGQHTVSIRAASGPFALDSLEVRQRSAIAPWLAVLVVFAGLALFAGLAVILVTRRRPWYERSRAG